MIGSKIYYLNASCNASSISIKNADKLPFLNANFTALVFDLIYLCEDDIVIYEVILYFKIKIIQPMKKSVIA